MRPLVFLLLMVAPMAMAGVGQEEYDPIGDEAKHYTPSSIANGALPCHDARIDLMRVAASSNLTTLSIEVDVLDPLGIAACGGVPIHLIPFAGARHTIVYGNAGGDGIGLFFQSLNRAPSQALVYFHDEYIAAGAVIPTDTGYRVDVPLVAPEYDLRGRAMTLHVASGSGEYAAAAPWLTDEAPGLAIVT